MTIGIVDYEMGNLSSVSNAFRFLGAPPVLLKSPQCFDKALDGIVLPGVGAFAQGMANLEKLGFVEKLEESVFQKKIPFLGICVGMQLLASRGHEHGDTRGLGWIPGSVVLMETPSSLRVPQMGWNPIKFHKDSRLFKGCEEEASFYFANSYHFVLEFKEMVSATCEYGGTRTAAVENKNIFGVQFHPEKSHEGGLKLLRNFVAICEGAET
jgi:imidazole glycerol-phosphate synthase subunit HisH